MKIHHSSISSSSSKETVNSTYNTYMPCTLYSSVALSSLSGPYSHNADKADFSLRPGLLLLLLLSSFASFLLQTRFEPLCFLRASLLPSCLGRALFIASICVAGFGLAALQLVDFSRLPIFALTVFVVLLYLYTCVWCSAARYHTIAARDPIWFILATTSHRRNILDPLLAHTSTVPGTFFLPRIPWEEQPPIKTRKQKSRHGIHIFGSLKIPSPRKVRKACFIHPTNLPRPQFRVANKRNTLQVLPCCPCKLRSKPPGDP